MDTNEQWLQWAVELQALAQAGLHYGHDVFDLERYTRIREIATEMLAVPCPLPKEKVAELFCCETGYQTPKLDTRAAIIENGRILLVRDRDGKWAMPGGWVDAGLSVAENAVKEALEEAGLHVRVKRVVAVQDREKHNKPVYAWKICKVLLLCELLSGEFVPNIETSESAWFTLDELPPLSEARNNREQIALCFRAYEAENWETVFD